MEVVLGSQHPFHCLYSEAFRWTGYLYIWAITIIDVVCVIACVEIPSSIHLSIHVYMCVCISAF